MKKEMLNFHRAKRLTACVTLKISLKFKSFVAGLTYIQLFLIKLATLGKFDPMSPISIATTQRCGGWRYSIPWIAPIYP